MRHRLTWFEDQTLWTVDAWARVMNGTSDCHDLARRIIAAESPVEFSRMLNYTKGWDL